MANRLAAFAFGLLRNWGLKLLIVLSAILWLTLVAVAWEGAAHAAEEPGLKPDAEYNFSWLDPEKKIYVLQNRKYLKGGHLLISAMGGTGFSNPYRSTVNLDPRIGFYFSEAWGVEGMYSLTANVANGVYTALATAAPSAQAIVREIRSQYGLLVDWAPWYAKINVFNKILYFDWYFEAGGGAMHVGLDTAAASATPVYAFSELPAAFLGTGHLFHLSQTFFVRLDFLASIYMAQVAGAGTANALYSDYKIDLGLGLRL